MGDRVKLIGSRQPGEIIEIKKDQFLLAIGALTTWTTRDKFIPAESLHGDQGTPKGKARGGVKEPDIPKETDPDTPKSKQDSAAEKKKAKKSVKIDRNWPNRLKKRPKSLKIRKNRGKANKNEESQSA